MKIKLLFFFSILLINVSFTQPAMTEVFFHGMPILSSNVMDNFPKIAKADSEEAASQIHRHISKRIKYPKVLEDYQIECTIKVLVKINEEGRINGFQIFESPSPAFDRAIKKATSGLKKIKTEYSLYYGVQNLLVPIHFSMDF